jgi:hypothetical protein
MSLQGLSRHVKRNCKIANTEDGMEKLIEYTLQRQLAAQTVKVDALQTQMTELTTMLQRQLLLTSGPMDTSINVAGTNTGRATNAGAGQINQANQINQINIMPQVPWDGESRIAVTLAQIVAAFEENVRFQEYASHGDRELTDREIALPYVVEILMDLVKRGHADPSARNVYLNPKRADQVLVHKKSGRWEVMPLAEATRQLFDGVVETIRAVARSHAEMQVLPLEAQNALAIAGMMYEEEPEEYVKRAKSSMAAHLANLAPQASQ